MAAPATPDASSVDDSLTIPAVVTTPVAPSVEEAVYLATRSTPPWLRFVGWLGVVGLVYALITSVSLISTGFRGLTGDEARSLFDFAHNPWVGLFVGVLVTVLIQSSTATTTMAVAAVGTGTLTLSSAIPIIMGANVGTTVTTTLIALGYIRNRDEYQRALAASSVHDFYNWLALLIFFPLELMFQPLERASTWLSEAMYDVAWLPDPANFDFMRAITRPVVNWVSGGMNSISSDAGPVLSIVIGAIAILLVVKYLGKLLKLLLVGRARSVLTRAAGGNHYAAIGTGLGVTFITQSSTITASVLVPFAGAGLLTTKQLYPVTVGANIGTTFTALFAAFTLDGPLALLGLQAAFVHLIYNLASLLLIYVVPVLRPIPLFLSEWLARVAADRKWVIAVYLIGFFIVLPLGVILPVALTGG